MSIYLCNGWVRYKIYYTTWVAFWLINGKLLYNWFFHQKLFYIKSDKNFCNLSKTQCIEDDDNLSSPKKQYGIYLYSILFFLLFNKKSKHMGNILQGSMIKLTGSNKNRNMYCPKTKNAVPFILCVYMLFLNMFQ